jgi:lantibiotic modifying enzyme
MPTTGATWQPLLQGEAAAEALQVAEEIAAALASEVAQAEAEDRTGSEASLSGGAAGQALFFDYAAQAFPAEERYRELAETCLDRAIEAVAERPMGFGLYAGFPGIAWAAEHLQRRAAAQGGEELAEGDINEEIDAALDDLLSPSGWRGPYDLIGGLVGLGVYALERLPRAPAADCLAAVVDRLAELAESSPGGVTWFTSPEHLGSRVRAFQPEGHYDLGLAHGVPAVLPLLALAWRAGVREQVASSLLSDGVRWLLAQREEIGSVSCFTTWIAPGVERTPARLAWCYGDPGVATALLAAARLAGRPDWEREALAIARRAAERPVEGAGVWDAGLCHGAFGVAHLFNRIHQATRDDLFARTARVWYREGLRFREPGRGVAGFAAWELGDGEEPRWRPDSGFLTGSAGIGLALLAAATPHEPAWDRVLLADIPGEPAAETSLPLGGTAAR